MNRPSKHGNPKRNVVRPVIMALALALPGTLAVAAQMTDVVTTRADQNISEQYGRDSVYAFSSDSKPLKPEQTMSRNQVQPTADASGFPSARRLMHNDPMDNDTTATVQQAPTDVALQDVNSSDHDGISSQNVGSGYTGSEEARAGQEVQYVVIAPLEIIASPAASATQDEATSEFVLIVPESGAIGSDQSAAYEENIPAVE